MRRHESSFLLRLCGITYLRLRLLTALERTFRRTTPTEKKRNEALRWNRPPVAAAAPDHHLSRVIHPPQLRRRR
jgi:hypothetical protein